VTGLRGDASLPIHTQAVEGPIKVGLKASLLGGFLEEYLQVLPIALEDT
jgi:hypothetical protein